MKESMQKLLSAIADIVGNAHLQANDISERYQHDWSSELPGMPLALIKPANTDELSRVMKVVHEAQQPVVVQGGLTGLCGGGNPQQGELAISLERMSGIEALDEAAMCMTVGAGTPLEEIQTAAGEAGFNFPLDLGARGSCQIGGNISTNAGGNQVLRFGMTRNLVLGLEVVLADGTVISSMNKMLKNNAGYDLKHLFIGTEGTLGIVCRAVLRLFPESRSQCSALLALPDFPSVVTLLRKLSTDFGPSLSTFEVMWSSYFHFITEHVEHASSPFETEHALYVLTEFEGAAPESDMEHFQQSLGQAMEEGLVSDAVIANSERERRAFWQIRDGVGDIGNFIRGCANFDISIPISSMEAFLDRLEADFSAAFPDEKKMVFGHIADSNLHLLCSAPDKAAIQDIYRLVYALVGEFQGSVSAEHGIGVQKLGFLHYSRSEAERELMRSLKTALDPHGILNPGRVVP